MSISKWMSWEGGVDLVALSNENIPMPNIIVHFARMVHTPVGSAPSGMILLPDETGALKIMGFVSTDETIGNYFGANIFAGTPFENAPMITGSIEVTANFPDSAGVIVKIEGYEVILELSGLGQLSRISRQSPNLPFYETSIESEAGKSVLTINGQNTSFILPPIGISGGHPSVYSPAGIYSR